MFSKKVNENIDLKIITYLETNEFYELIQKNMDHLKKFMPRISENTSVSDTENVLKNFYKQLYDNNGFRVGIYFNNKLIGVSGLKYIDWINHSTEIMYWIDKDYSGKGITKLVVDDIVKISFDILNLNRIVIKVNKHNYPSIRIAEKCNFYLEGTLIGEELIDGKYCDTKIYSRVKKI